jgi:hypothetical protein
LTYEKPHALMDFACDRTSVDWKNGLRFLVEKNNVDQDQGEGLSHALNTQDIRVIVTLHILRPCRARRGLVPEGGPIVAWHEVPRTAPPQRSRPVGYGLIRAGMRTDSMIGVICLPKKHGAPIDAKYLWD